jgi:hypothetical protein
VAKAMKHGEAMLRERCLKLLSSCRRASQSQAASAANCKNAKKNRN